MSTPQNLHRLNQAKRLLTEAGLEFAIKGFDGQIHGTLTLPPAVVAKPMEAPRRTRGPSKYDWAKLTGYVELLAAMVPGDVLDWDVRDFLGQDLAADKIIEAAESLRSTLTARAGAFHGARTIRSIVSGPVVKIQHSGGF